MIVYVLDVNGKPLMPTKKSGKVRHMLNDGRAKVVRRTPFTIQLLYTSTSYIQPVTLGVKPGYERMLLSAATKEAELYSGTIELRTDIPSLLENRWKARSTRRYRLRYRPARFRNRTHSKPKGWLAPSVRQKIDAHLQEVQRIVDILPVSIIKVEVAKFDVQKLIDPNISGKDYQKGHNYYNIKEYVFSRDKHKCRICKGAAGDPVLCMHFIKDYLSVGRTPADYKKHYNVSNVIAVCRTCRDLIDNGEIETKIKRGGNFKKEAFLNVARWKIVEELRDRYGSESIKITFGYLTKQFRNRFGLYPTSENYGFCICGIPNAKKLEYTYYTKRTRNHNRKLYKANPGKGGIYIKVQSPQYINGFKMWDKVEYNGQVCFVAGRNRKGYLRLKTIDGKMIHASARMKDVRILERGTSHPIQMLQLTEPREKQKQ